MDEPEDQDLRDALSSGNVGNIATWLEERAPHDIAEEFTRLDSVQSALVWRLLNRDRALEVFEELGVLAGLVFVIISPTDVITPIVGGLFIGAGVGMVAGMLIFTFSAGPKRLYRSLQQVIAQSYRVVVDTQQHSQAVTAMESHESGSDS